MPDKEPSEKGVPELLEKINDTLREVKRLLELLLEKTSP